MKKYIISILLILIFVLSVGAISAHDVNETVAGEVTTIGSLYSSSKSFTDLNNDIQSVVNASGEEFNMSDDYLFDDEIDDGFEAVDLSSLDLTINGNNHIIDAKNKADIFSMMVGNLTLNDLTLINCNKSFLTASFDCNVVLNNVSFIDNGSDFQTRLLIDLFMINSLILNNCSFHATTNYGSDINAVMSPVVVKDSVFSGGNTFYYGHIVAAGSKLTIDNVTFENLCSIYSSTIYGQSNYVSVKNSRFRNLNSNLTAGAIGIKFLPVEGGEDLFLIENSTFENVSCKNDGGAIFCDCEGFDVSIKGYPTLNLVDCSFYNCSSNFGGAILQLDGELNITNSIFAGNLAETSGGAIYTSCAALNIVNSTLSGNVANDYAGAIFFDEGNLNILNSSVTGNEIKNVRSNSPNALYTYNANVNIENSFFNNTGLSIYGMFSNFTGADNINDEISINNTEYKTYWVSSSIDFILVNNTISVDNLPSRFDLRDWNWVGDVENQGIKGSCWAFGTIGAIESTLLKATGIKYTFSVNDIYDNLLKYTRYGNVFMSDGTYIFAAAPYMLSWRGIQPGRADIYDEMGKISDYLTPLNETIHVQDVILIYGQKNDTAINLKEALIKYGALAVTYYASDDFSVFYNPETAAYYCYKEMDIDHGVTLVGWDDNYPKENFLKTPPGNGAWICKNSWGTEWGDNGYFYLSYYDKSFLYSSSQNSYDGAVCYIFENNISYHINYETDFSGLGIFDENHTYYSNEFDSVSDDLIGAVGTYFNQSGIEYELKVYVNGVLRHTQSGTSPFAGFKTIVLDKYVPVKAGDHFKVEFKSNSVPVVFPTRLHALPEVSFISNDGKKWVNISEYSGGSISLKVYTVADDTKITGNKNIAADYNGGSYFSVTVVTADGRKVGAGESVKFKIDGKTTTVQTNNNGIAKIKITQTPKKYTITTTYKGNSVTNTVTVKQVLTSSKVSVKKTAKKFTLKAKLKINGKLMKGKTIKFKLKGKTYTVKTNSNGIAQKILGKKIIKNLKKGKTYTVRVTYCKDTIKTTLKVQ